MIDPATESYIDALVAMDDATLMETLGFNARFKNAKKSLAELAQLSGEARKFAEQRVRRQLSPDINDDSLGWLLEDAKRHEKGNEIKDCCG